MKTDPNGQVELFNADYVAKVHKQSKCIDHFETFASTSKPEIFRTLFAVTAKKGLILRQLDVKSAYPHPKVEKNYLGHCLGF